jgi:hypothetical protein
VALSHVTKVFAVEDCKIAPITADVSGSATTYGTIVDVPGIKSIGVKGDMKESELRGDNGLMDIDSVLRSATLTIEHAKLSLDVFAGLFGLTVVDSGTTPNQKSTLSFAVASGSVRPKPVKIEGKTPTGGIDVITGDLHIVFYKVILTSFPEHGFAEEDYQTLKFEAKAMPTLGTGNKWFDYVENETAAVIT